MNKLKVLFVAYFLGIISLFFYSFTQIDLNLTISKASVIQFLEKQFQYIGFFQRPLSATIFAFILIALFINYLFILYFAKKGILKINKILIMSLSTTVILIFSYNAFSYDLFNYIFYGKIITFYHQNLYLFAPSHFTGDPMLNFMRWTHVSYPYGPGWLILSLPLSVLGFGFFIPTFFLYKTLIGFSYFLSVYLIYKISEKISPQEKLFNTVFFAFNPLVIIECLVSSHNDISMFVFVLLAFYLSLNKKRVLSWVSNLFSISVKFSTAVLLPVFVLIEYLNFKNKKINWSKLINFSVILSLVVIFAEIQRTNFQPWYLIFPLLLSSLNAKKSYILAPAIVASIAAASIYIPYVLLTDYAPNYPQVINSLEMVGLVLFLVSLGLMLIRNKISSSH